MEVKVLMNFVLNNLISGHVGSDRFSGDYIDVDFHAGKISAIWASYDGYAKIYNRTVMEQELEQLFPIHQVGPVYKLCVV